VTSRFRESAEDGGAYLHSPPLQVCGLVQVIPQPPQFVSSRRVSTQTPASLQFGRWVVQEHVELSQIAPLWHASLQAPQLARSRVVSTQMPLQSVVDAGQAHLPATQVVPPVQAIPQAPQLSTFVCASTQAPAQFVSAAAQVVPHAPALQT
jgi:hypothetical protein